MLYREQPADFKTTTVAVATMVECQGKLLFLRRHPERRYPGKWGCAGGKLELGETVVEGAIRELREETGIIAVPSSLIYCGQRFVRYPNDQDFIYHQFWLPLKREPRLHLNLREHDQFVWVPREEAAQVGYLGEPDDILECLRMIPAVKVDLLQ